MTTVCRLRACRHARSNWVSPAGWLCWCWGVGLGLMTLSILAVTPVKRK